MATIKLRRPDTDESIRLSIDLCLRFIRRESRNSKDGRYILQARTVVYGKGENDMTWIDVPLCPEIYGP